MSTNSGVDWSVHAGVEPAIRINGTPVPEPGTLALVGLGLLTIGARSGRRQRR